MKINYKGLMLTVRGGAWLDIMNSCFYVVVDRMDKYTICAEIGNNELFALPCVD